MGLLDQSYLPTLSSLWYGTKARITETGDVVDGCTGTGALETEQDYIVRKALSGYYELKKNTVRDRDKIDALFLEELIKAKQSNQSDQG